MSGQSETGAEACPVCPVCQAVQPRSFFNTGLHICPSCGSQCRVEVFPALFAPRSAERGEKLVLAGEPGCFYHPGKQAVVPCDSCGRFLCALCAVDLGDRRLCPQCIQTGKQKRKLRDIEDHRPLYDGIVLRLAIYPMLFFFATAITAPAVLYLTVKHWRSPSSIIKRSKFRFVLAFSLALLQVSGWLFIAAHYIKK